MGKPDQVKDAGVDAAPVTTAPAVSQAPPTAALATVQALVAQGRGAAEIAAVLAANPAARGEILTYLHMTRGNAFVEEVLSADSPLPKQAELDPVQGAKEMVAIPLFVGGQWVQIYVSPGGINSKPDVFMFFHGQNANLMVDPKAKEGGGDNVSGNDVAGAAMAQARAKNTIAILPQGIDGVKGGGDMKGLDPKKGGLVGFLDEILDATATKLGRTDKVRPHHIALAGHSAGGYMGVHEALSTAGKYGDTITDLTLMDSEYSPSHFADAATWMYAGSPGKTVRIVQSERQIKHSYVSKPDPTDAKKSISVPIDPAWRDYFGETEMKSHAPKGSGFTVTKLVSPPKKDGELDSADRDRGNKTKVFQHSQLVNGKGEVQCDVLVMQSELGHHEIRDNVMDDALDSIGQGGKDADQFGRNQIPQYGRDKDKPHRGNAEGPFSDEELAEQKRDRERKK